MRLFRVMHSSCYVGRLFADRVADAASFAKDETMIDAFSE